MTDRPRISVITLGVSDVDASIRFYRDVLGFEIGAVKGKVTYFDTGTTWLAVYPRGALAKYAGVAAEGKGFSGVTLARNVATPEEVDTIMERARAGGADIVKPAAEVGWGGYTGWFRDPDAHLWEVVWNPRPFAERDS